MSTKPKAEERPAVLFLKHAFDDIVHGIDESISAVPGGSAHRGFLLEGGVWTREHWERAVELGAGDLSSCDYLIDETGIWLRPRYPWENQHDYFTWHPQAECEQGEDPRQSAILPFPFNCRQFAACWLGPPGSDIYERMVACIEDADGNIAAAAMFMAPDPNSVGARHGLQAAWEAWQEAIAAVGVDEPVDRDTTEARKRHAKAKDQVLRQHNYQEDGISEEERAPRRNEFKAAMAQPDDALATALYDAKHPRIEWRKAMVRALLPRHSSAPQDEQKRAQPTRPAMKRNALERKHETRWPSVRRDIKGASKNGLKAAAKAPNFGYYFEDKALAWAEASGRIATTSAPLSIDRLVHRMKDR